MIRTTCGACGGGDIATVLDLGKTPLANKFPASVDEQENWYPLQLGRCGTCGLVQQMCVIPDDEIYGEDYGFYSGGSAAQREYHSVGAAQLLHTFGPLAEKLTVEIACNDGSLLRHFQTAGCNVLGVDPAAPAKVALDAGLPVIQAPFTANLAREIREDNGPAGLIIAYNSLAHVGDLSDVLTGIWALLDEWGVAVVEFQYLPDLLVGNMYDQVYHEHRYFYSLTSFMHAAGLHGLQLLDAELIELQGGGLRVTLTSRQNVMPSNRARRILASEQWLNSENAFYGLQGRIDRARDHLLDLLARERADGRRVSGYAAAAKATTILNYCGITRTELPSVIDTTPYKQGRYVPGVKIPITDDYDPADIDTFLLLAPNYLGHVLRTHHGFTHGGGRWLVPTPTPTLI
jgi:methylation protein EvaC